ncbi:hypothetical protein IUY40_16260 [Flavobacterium sp. ALJ2]|uniref:hypothetical protein n=1 Tax=Flavobacterium sp. ALJ2 TaxID=2786960 RepID=UPI0018A0F62B|nr:hypothetical protein [Flavobacterium sp. ALJ2]MBF7093087.1 hypothetical protein [Flavobacterium sp. ALJ2]
MGGVLKNKYHVIFLCLIGCSLISCQRKTENPSTFIENNFLAIVDTVAYKHGAFVIPPPLPNGIIEKRPLYPHLAIELNKKIRYNKRIEKDVLTFFNLNKKVEADFKDLLENGNYFNFSLDKNFQKKIGKYYVFFDEKKIDKKIKYVGRIDIENLKIYKNKAILVLSESVGGPRRVGSFGRTYIVLLAKEDNAWKIVKKELLYMT